MPDQFPPEIQDLISRMLTVDPQQRITIPEIKEHPAFRMFLPQNYLLPTPFGIPFLPDPIDPSTIDSNIMSVLTHIGYESEEEVVSHLTSEQHNMAKVFFRMYNHTFSLENLPWHQDSYEMHLNAPSEAFEMSPMAQPMNIFQGQNDPFYRRPKIPDMSSPDVYSLAHQASWGAVANTNQLAINGTESFVNLPTPIERVLAPIENYLAENGYDFFHPDELTIYTRKVDSGLYVIFKIAYEAIDSYTIQVSKASLAQVNEFSELINDITSIIDSMVMIR
ncbi:putative CAMK family protein kinase [Tritrichomonas foetus]|uniref:CAMK family protein kinase n=1 Tax=Tritrichomonas foetus TaxID=1144522 RepID=A0A1J4KF68_9EUKA|nr:putative CAMK family protein kinase [Tritrichomonas foetus]|eukprot:OHT08412.1 putative CAMK family protein kinase [Tritrichomonas foetus]